MHAVVIKVNIQDFETARKMLGEEIVPRISQSPGFVAGYWTRSEDGSNGLSMAVFESEEAAQGMATMLQEQGIPSDQAVTLESLEVREVVANA